jgi:poly(A) polymerase
MISLSQMLTEGALEKAAEDFIRQTIKGTEWDGKVLIAGGYVRDALSGKDPKDIDLMVDAPNGGIDFANWITQKIGAWSEGNPVTFPRFGTAKFNLRGVVHNGIDLSTMDIEAVMPRQESYTPGSRKPEVQFSNLKGDAERRDLTVNAMYKNISTGEYLDPTGMGMQDLKAGIIRTPIDPTKTFTDDPLRMLRITRFFAKYGWRMAPGLIKALKDNAPQLDNISKERIQEELNKMLVTTRPEKAMKLLKLTGLMDHIVPEFKLAYKMSQNVHHSKDVWGHTLDVLKNTQPELLNRLTALFHDIGKVATRQVTPKGIQFIGHEKEGAEMAGRIMQNLKYPAELTKAVMLGVANHMKLKHGGDDAANLSDKSLNKFKREVGDKIENILDVINADNISHSDESSMPNQINIVRKRLEALAVHSPQKKELPVDGNDIQRELRIKPGKIIGVILGAIVEWWDDPKNQNLSPEEARSQALELARSIAANNSQLKEGVHLDYLNQKIAKLEQEWDNLDSQGTGQSRQLEISFELTKLRRDLAKWSKLHKAVDLAETTSLRTLKGTPIKRYKNLVGKQVGPQLYVHKNYANRVIPQPLLDRAEKVLKSYAPGYVYNTVMLDAKTGAIRFDESPDFDTAREPHVGKHITVMPDGTIREGSSNSIWHHKWQWVMDDYRGFDVESSKAWSRQWLAKVPEVAKGTDPTWSAQLQKYGLQEETSTTDRIVPQRRGNKFIVYHGTNSQFKSFSLEKSTMGIVWFTTDKDKIIRGESGAAGRSFIITAEVTLNNPCGWPEYEKLGLWELKSRGYDGAILDSGDNDGHFDCFVFKSNQIKILKREPVDRR